MTAHRPLSAWIAAVERSVDGTVQWPSSVAVNYGDERADARALPQFDDGWQRRAIALDSGYQALGLVRDALGEAVVELDNYARPIPVSQAAAVVIDRMEDAWPEAALQNADLAVLAGESETIRYLVAGRLADEGDPPPALFHILPWDLVDRLATQVAEVLDGAEPAPVITELRYWFTPVGSRFTAALEQMDEGLRDGDAALIRVAATALCARLLEVDPARLPQLSRATLAGLVGMLGRENPFLEFTARRAIARLVPADDTEPAGDTGQVRAIRIGTRLPAAADSATGIRAESREAVREPFTVRLVVTAMGRAEIAVSAALSAELERRVDDSYGVMLLPVSVTAEGGSTRYLIPLESSDGHLSGRLDLPVPAGRFVEADVGGPPIGVTEAALLNPDEVRRSIRGLRSRSGRALWNQVADLLPQAHPLRTLITMEME